MLGGNRCDKKLGAVRQHLAAACPNRNFVARFGKDTAQRPAPSPRSYNSDLHALAPSLPYP